MAAKYPNALDCDHGAEDAVARVARRQVEVVGRQLIGISHEAQNPSSEAVSGLLMD